MKTIISTILLLNLCSWGFNLKDYQELLSLTTGFYGAQRCGETDNWLLREGDFEEIFCHHEDGKHLGLDLQGGWHDAGDFIKFTRTIAWSSYILLKAWDATPKALPDFYQADGTKGANGIPDLLDEVRVALDYLARTLQGDSVLIARVGGDQDHNYLYTSPAQTFLSTALGGGERPVYKESRADVAGLFAAALALGSNAFKDVDSNFSKLLQKKSRDAFSYGLKNPGTTQDTYYPEGKCLIDGQDKTWQGSESYAETRCKGRWQDGQWEDAMMAGAVEIFRNGGDSSYLQKAQKWNELIKNHGWVMDWITHHDLARHSLALLGDSSAIHWWRQDVDKYITKVSDKKNIKGLAHFNEWGSLRYAMNAAFSSFLLFSVTSEKKYYEFGASQLHYSMGDNEYHRSFIVGWGQNPPKYPHHKNAYGHDLGGWHWKLDYKYSLKGALVGGPTLGDPDGGGPTTAGYVDNIQDYVSNEVSIEYNAALVGLLAFIVNKGG